MTKVFISYSRKDIEFAKRLTGELQKSDLDFWVDWEGIPPTVDWWKQIEKGIEEADAFLFLISPDSAASKVCGREIEHAVKNGKRLIPLIVRDIKGGEAPSQLSHLNWIFFRESDDFETALKKLLDAIHTDYEWAQTHRRLQVKALEWERNNHENSFLLRGKDLQEAELQLAANLSKEPHPTNLQREYVFESRQVVDSQRRIITSISITSAIILAALTVFAFIQLNISRAQKLGFQSEVAFAEENYNAAMLYAYQSNLIASNDAASRVLRLLHYQNFVRGKGLFGHLDWVTSVAWSADGQLASGSKDGTVIIWDLKTGQPARTLKRSNDSVTCVAWSLDGQLASGSQEDGTVIIWDLKTGKPARTLQGGGYSVAWSADGQLASGSKDGTVIIWDLKTGQPARTLKGGGYNVAWSADGRLASGLVNSTIIIWDLKTGKPAQILKGGGNSVAWSADGRLASGSQNGTVIWNLKTGKPAQILKGGGNSVAWSVNGQLASGSENGTVIIWDLNTGKPDQILQGQSQSVNSVAWFKDGRLASGSNDKTVVIWDLKTEQPAQTLKGHADAVRDVAWSANGLLASGSEDGTIIVWDLKTGQPTQTLLQQGVTSIAWSTDGRLASGSSNGSVIVWNLETGQPFQILKGHTSPVTSVAWSSDGHLASGSADAVTLGLDGTVIIWDLKTGQPNQTIKEGSWSTAWSPDGRLASGSENGTIIIWGFKTRWYPTKTLPGHTSRVTSIAWSADGRLASGEVNGTVIIWNLNTGKPTQTIQGGGEGIAWSADGRLASGVGFGRVAIWDVNTGRLIQTLNGQTELVWDVAWSPNGLLASGSSDRTIMIARSDMASQTNFCELIFRNMSVDEWIKYQGVFYIYQPACPNLSMETISFPTWAEWWKWSSLKDMTYTPNRFLLLTWPGRGVILIILASLFWLYWSVKNGSIGWGAGVIGIGVFINFVMLFNESMLFLYFRLWLLPGLGGLLYNFILFERNRRKS